VGDAHVSQGAETLLQLGIDGSRLGSTPIGGQVLVTLQPLQHRLGDVAAGFEKVLLLLWVVLEVVQFGARRIDELEAPRAKRADGAPTEP